MIRSTRLLNTYLWRRYRYQKQGILDVLVELNDDTKINIELQVKAVRNWDKRQLFYLGKMLTEEISFGRSYDVMKRCVAISILDFNLTEDKQYHKTYLLRDEEGRLFSNLLELHVIELNKVLMGQNIDEWIRFFNVKTEGDLDMLRMQTNNAGILEAIKEVEHMSLSRWAKAQYEEHMKRVMDRKAEDAYVFDRGVERGIEQGIEQGIGRGRQLEKENLIKLISSMNAGGDTDKVAQLDDPEVLLAMQRKYGMINL
jgi:predicted transposase/invertase (TIGR01784 family)